jgi:Xaa-Pro aminopeptidase
MNTLARIMIVVLALGLPGCTVAEPTLQAVAVTQGSEPTQVLVEVQGAVNVKRAGRSEFVPGMFGMVLRRGDLLRLDSGAQAKVACADLTLADAASGTGAYRVKPARRSSATLPPAAA